MWTHHVLDETHSSCDSAYVRDECSSRTTCASALFTRHFSVTSGWHQRWLPDQPSLQVVLLTGDAHPPADHINQESELQQARLLETLYLITLAGWLDYRRHWLKYLKNFLLGMNEQRGRQHSEQGHSGLSHCNDLLKVTVHSKNIRAHFLWFLIGWEYDWIKWKNLLGFFRSALKCPFLILLIVNVVQDSLNFQNLVNIYFHCKCYVLKKKKE